MFQKQLVMIEEDVHRSFLYIPQEIYFQNLAGFGVFGNVYNWVRTVFPYLDIVDSSHQVGGPEMNT